jgi:hypothetical protein
MPNDPLGKPAGFMENIIAFGGDQREVSELMNVSDTL